MEKVEGPRSGAKNMKLDLGDTNRAGRVVLELEAIGYGYDGVNGSDDSQDGRLLEDLSLVVERGESVAMLGPNGTGKSTLMRLATGEITPDTAA